MNENKDAKDDKKKGFFSRMMEKLDKKIEEKAQKSSCCDGSSDHDKRGSSCC